MPDPWTEIAVDGLPASDMSGDVTLYEVYDGYTVHLTGRFDDNWMTTKDGPVTPTQWKLWFNTDPPPEPGWISMDDFVRPTTPYEFIEVYDGATTNLTGWAGGEGGTWIEEVPNGTHWRYPKLSDPPAP